MFFLKTVLPFGTTLSLPSIFSSTLFNGDSNVKVAGAPRGLPNDQLFNGNADKWNPPRRNFPNSEGGLIEASAEDHKFAHTPEPKLKAIPTSMGKTPTPNIPAQRKPTARKKYPHELENGLLSARVDKPIAGNYRLSEGEVIVGAVTPSESEQIPPEEQGELVNANTEGHKVAHALETKPTPAPMDKTPTPITPTQAKPTPQKKYPLELESGLLSARVDQPITGNYGVSEEEVIVGPAISSEPGQIPPTKQGEMLKANTDDHKVSRAPETKPTPIPMGETPTPITPTQAKPTPQKKKYPLELESGLLSARVDKPIAGNYRLSEEDVIVGVVKPSESEAVKPGEQGEMVEANTDDHKVPRAPEPKPTPTPMDKTPTPITPTQAKPTPQKKYPLELESELLSARVDKPIAGNYRLSEGDVIVGVVKPSEPEAVKPGEQGEMVEANNDDHKVSRAPEPKPTPIPMGKTPTPITPTQAKLTPHKKKYPLELESGLLSARVNKPIAGNYRLSEGDVIVGVVKPSEPEAVKPGEQGEMVEANNDDHKVSRAPEPKPTPIPMGKTPTPITPTQAKPTPQKKYPLELESGLLSARVNKPIAGNYRLSEGDVIVGVVKPSEPEAVKPGEQGEMVEANTEDHKVSHAPETKPTPIPMGKTPTPITLTQAKPTLKNKYPHELESGLLSASPLEPNQSADDIQEETVVQNTEVKNISAIPEPSTMGPLASRDVAGTHAKKVGSSTEKPRKEEPAREDLGTVPRRVPDASKSATLPKVGKIIMSLLDEVDEKRILEQVKSYITEMSPPDLGKLTIKIKQFLDGEYGDGWQVAIVKGSYSKTCTHGPKCLLECVINDIAYLMWKTNS
ncbi:unnamed protein product [Calicophoron daubneyi]|uniref:Uncharacterized protein n=1 Tax=Calicophoron daubneyi TaxID=300641 RepID=A0AAV2T160_CALDB